ncbi:NlpC/P60 family protein [Pyruvatibacter mobilis]|uniref:NlpC/P60 family protein n=1 Tax=Pyruvatibacter mobilis TaxID=1712261 RepID=UPI003BA9820F
MMQPPAWVSDYVGIPFEDHGRTHQGCDCWGLVRLVLAEQAGIRLPCYGHSYEAATQGDVLAPLIGTEKVAWTSVPAGCERALDGVLMKGYFGVGRQMRAGDFHVGVVVAPGLLMHVERGTDTCLVSYRRDRRVRYRLRGFYRHAGLS